jgi:hypothetical protein
MKANTIALKAKRQKSQFFAWNGSEWWVWFSGHRRCPTKQSLTRYINNHESIVVFHGCRPLNVDAYYSEGLKPSNLDLLNDFARRIFLSGEFPEISETNFSSTVQSMTRLDQGKAYVVLDEQELIQSCGHYMIYGSEHLCGIAASLSRGISQDYRQVLKRFGIPTVFKIAIPTREINQSDLEELAEEIRENFWDLRTELTPPLLNWTFTLETPVPPRQILDHNHPAEIPDPLLGRIIYRRQQNLISQARQPV